jgi:hypothetical protein
MWRQQLETERSNLLRRVIALRKALEWFSGPFRVGDAEEHRKQMRETGVALLAAERTYERFCVQELHRDPWPKPVSLKLSAAERAAVARRKAAAPVSRSAPARQADLTFKNADAYRRYFRAAYPGR